MTELRIQSLLVKNKPFNLKVGLEHEFRDEIPDKYRISSNGVANRVLSTAYVFIDNLVNVKNLYPLDIWEHCFYCKNAIISCPSRGTETLEGCRNGIEIEIECYSQEINRVAIHELIHLCGTINEGKTRVFERILAPFFECPYYDSEDADS